jgi:cytochrome c556
MKKLILIISVVTGGLVATAIAHEGHSHATGVVRERMELMTEMGDHLIAIAKRLRANKGFDAIPNDAHVIHQLAAKIPPLFPAGSTQHPTAAKPAVWKDFADFAAEAKKMEAEAEKLMNTSTTDGARLREQFRALAYACDSCHQKYRITKGP